jgi:hypothetical protein
MRLCICIFFKEENVTGIKKARFEDFDERSANFSKDLRSANVSEWMRQRE